jgi:hypothetical protein
MAAARNALAMARGIRIDSTGKVADLADGVVRVRGVIRGHKTVETRWVANADPPECMATLRVPLWGLEGVASAFARGCRYRMAESKSQRIELTAKQADVGDLVLVLDGRGLELSPCLFPCVVDTDGRVLYDLTTMPPATAPSTAPVRYVETAMSYEQLEARLRYKAPFWFLPASHSVQAIAASKPALRPAASRPSKPVRRRAKRRMAVRVTALAGRERTQLVLTKADAERLRRSSEAASALRKAQVLVVVDPAAAGTEGRLPPSILEGHVDAWARR